MAAPEPDTSSSTAPEKPEALEMCLPCPSRVSAFFRNRGPLRVTWEVRVTTAPGRASATAWTREGKSVPSTLASAFQKP